MAQPEQSARSGAELALTPDVEATLRSYVLGQLEEEPRIAIEERLIADAGVFEALGVIEDELIEEHLEGAGAHGGGRGFEAHFLVRPEGVRRLRLARALKERASSQAREPLPTVRPVPGRLARAASVQAFLGLAAVLVVSLAGNVWLASRNQGDDRREPPAPSVATPRPAVATRDFAAELEAERARASAIEERLAASAPTFVRLAAAPQLRSAGTLALVSVPKGAVIVGLRVELRSDDTDYPRYRAALVDPDGDEIWVGSKLQAEGPAGHRAVPVILPAGFLPRGDYRLKLSGLPDQRAPEALRSYSFRVSRP